MGIILLSLLLTLATVAPVRAAGWYLIKPPIVNHTADTGAPMTGWTIAASFDTAAECQDTLSHMHEGIAALKNLSREQVQELEGEAEAQGRTLLPLSEAIKSIDASICVPTENFTPHPDK